MPDRRCIHTFQNAHPDEVTDLKVSSDDKYIVSIGGIIEKHIKVWDLYSKSCTPCYVFENAHYSNLTHFDVNSTAAIKGIIISSDNQFLCSGAYDSIQVFGFSDFSSKFSFKQPHNEPVSKMAITKNGNLLISAGEDRSVKVWHLYKQECVFKLEEAHTGNKNDFG